MLFFGSKPKSILGIDIGTSSIKVVQLKKIEDKFKLETYGDISTIGYLDRLNESFQTTSLRTLEAITREMLKIVLKKAETTTRHAILTIPVFSSFTSVIEMPEISDKELVQAIEFEARKYIPIPLAEVVLDWKIIETGMIRDSNSPKSFRGKRILLIAVPKEVVNKYIRIAEALNLKVNALELENFSFARSLALNEINPLCILDIGARATSCSIVEKGMVQMSHGLDIAGAEMTRTLASSLGIAFGRAEDFKLAHGINHQGSEERKESKETLVNLIDEILLESERMINHYQAKTEKKIEKIILNGGSAQMEGLKEYVEKRLNIKTFIADPWSRIIYPPSLQSILKDRGPLFSVAVGAAMREE